jgi:exonuclease SbcC
MKFKRVEIQAFKSYIDKIDGTFDFTVKGDQPADIVSIFAPNGFGKTSFYDAIDFCMTNNITRFIRDPSLANVNNTDAKAMNVSGEKQHILRAKGAHEDLESVVKIITETGEFERIVKPARAGSKDYSYADKNTAPQELYFRSVMLSQEAIDGFLRELKPEARYERFMLEQLGGDDSLEKNRQQIHSMLDIIKSRLSTLQGLADDITNKNLLIELGGEFVLDASCLTTINEQVTVLNELGCTFFVIDEAFDKESNARLLLQIAQKEEGAIKDIEASKESKAEIEHFLNDFPIHEKNHHRIADLNKIITKLKKQKGDIEQFQLLSEEKKLLGEQFDKQGTLIEKLQLRDKQLPEFVSKIHTKRKHNELLAGINEKFTKNEQRLKNNQALTDELEKQRSASASKKEEFETLRKDAPKYFSEISRIEESIQNENSIELTANNDELERQIANVKSEGVLIKSFNIEDLDIISACKFNNEILARIAKQYSDSFTKQEGLLKRLEEINNLLDSAALQKDSISTLIRLGSQLINHNQDEHCPLCQHKHESFVKLADAINSNSSLSDAQQRILKDLEACQTELTQEGDKLKKQSEEFFIQQIGRLDFLREELKSLLQDKKSISSRLDNIDKGRQEVSKFKELTAQQKPERFNLYIAEEIKKEAKAVSELENQISAAKGECQNLIKESQQLNIDLVETTSKLGVDDEFIKDYSDFLADFQTLKCLIDPGFDEQNLKEVIVSYLKNSTNLLEGKKQEIKDNDIALNLLRVLYHNNFFDDLVEQKDKLQEQTTKLSEELSGLNVLVREFYTIIKQLGLDHKLEGDNWMALKQAFEHKISYFHHILEQNRALTSGLKSLSTLSEQVLTYVDFVKSTEKRQSLELEIKQCSEIKDALIADRKVINDSLKAQVDHYFHVDLINTIYKKIDPHPDFKLITFNCTFPDDGKPKLQVYVKDDEGNNIVSPTLSFSSAQINVLSLSIFLAKALNTKNADNAVDCIFIDDPVQSMDSINVLGVIDLLRSLSINLGKQIIISTHDDNFHALLKQKLPDHLFKSKFLELESFGKVAPHFGQ